MSLLFLTQVTTINLYDTPTSGKENVILRVSNCTIFKNKLRIYVAFATCFIRVMRRIFGKTGDRYTI